MGILRNALRKLLDRELGVLGGELQRLEDKVADLQTTIEAFSVRYERLANRVQMRAARARDRDAPEGLSEFEAAIQRAAALRGTTRGGRAGADEDDIPDFRNFQ